MKQTFSAILFLVGMFFVTKAQNKEMEGPRSRARSLHGLFKKRDKGLRRPRIPRQISYGSKLRRNYPYCERRARFRYSFYSDMLRSLDMDTHIRCEFRVEHTPRTDPSLYLTYACKALSKKQKINARTHFFKK